MHFWINKPAGRSRAIGGCRRYHAGTTISASSLQASIPLLKTRTGRRESRNQSIRTSPMVSTNNNNRYNSHWSTTNSRSCGRCTVYYPRSDDLNGENAGQSTAARHAGHHQTNNIANNTVTNAAHIRRVLPNDSTLNRGIIDISEISNAELAGYRLRCGVWITFVLATGFVSIAKFYFSHRPDKGLDVLIFCGLLVTLLISGCFYSTLFRRTRNNPHYHVPEIPIATVATGVTTNDNTNHQGIEENLTPTLIPTSPQLQRQTLDQHLDAQIMLMPTLPQHQSYDHHHYPHQQQQAAQITSALYLSTSSPTLPSPSPPPYHIAILIPPSSSAYEAPPPSYEKATR